MGYYEQFSSAETTVFLATTRNYNFWSVPIGTLLIQTSGRSSQIYRLEFILINSTSVMMTITLSGYRARISVMGAD